MNETEAIAYAAEWGSLMIGGDPGACMYGFSPETGLKVQSEQHRTNCLEWIDRCKGKVIDDPKNYEADDLDKLNKLAGMILDAPLDTDETTTQVQP